MSETIIPSDPTPTRMRWRLEEENLLVGVEWPTNPEHHNRLAGKNVIDNGEYRERFYLVFELPTDVGNARKFLRYTEQLPPEEATCTDTTSA